MAVKVSARKAVSRAIRCFLILDMMGLFLRVGTPGGHPAAERGVRMVVLRKGYEESRSVGWAPSTRGKRQLSRDNKQDSVHFHLQEEASFQGGGVTVTMRETAETDGELPDMEAGHGLARGRGGDYLRAAVALPESHAAGLSLSRHFDLRNSSWLSLPTVSI
jgi:hypothetical protein